MVKRTAAGKTEPAATAGTQPATTGKRRVAGEADVWQPLKRGEKLEGTYVDLFHFVGKKFAKEQAAYKILAADGMKVVFGSGRLDRLMGEIPKGSKVFLTYLGRMKQGQNDNVHDWSVEYETVA
jgi:hypothetical protein